MKKVYNIVLTRGILLLVIVFGLVACVEEPNGGGPGGGEIPPTLTEDTPTGQGDASVTFSFKLDGKVDHEQHNPKAGKVYFTITRMPQTIREFRGMYEALIKEPHGSIPLLVVAIEMYRRHRAIGTVCLKLCNAEANLGPLTRRLDDLFRPNADPQYARPYLAAACFKGATRDNGMNPDYPYVLEMQVNPNSPYQDSPLTGGKIYYLGIYSQAWSKKYREIDIIRPYLEEKFLIFSCPSITNQILPIRNGEWKGLK